MLNAYRPRQWARVSVWLGCMVALGACATGDNEPLESFDDRADLEIIYLDSYVDGGVSGSIQFDIPAGVESMLIEVRGESGRYYLTKFVTPAGRDLVEASQLVTRGARELPGLVTWLYPNTPEVAPEPGSYEILIRAEDGAGGHIDAEHLDVRIYLEREGASKSCGIHVDFLVADDAIVATDVEPMVDQVVAGLRQLYNPVGIDVLGYTSSSIHLPTADLDLGGNPARVIGDVGEVMEIARASGQVRSQAVHVTIVRSLGQDLRGYSMGLPGPMGSDLPTSAVLVASSAFLDRDGFLDVTAMNETIAHEIGHYLGLYHTSEFDRLFHDPVPDTFECRDIDCPDEFWFNLMTPGGTGRTLLTPGQGFVMRNHPLCIAGGAPPDPPMECDLVCDAPYTCALIDNTASCALACDPSGAPCPDGGACLTDQQGKYICSGP